MTLRDVNLPAGWLMRDVRKADARWRQWHGEKRMTHSIEEMVRECEAHARIEDYWASANPVGSTLHIERTDAAARLRAAARVLRMITDDNNWTVREFKERVENAPPLAAAVAGAGEEGV